MTRKILKGIVLTVCFYFFCTNWYDYFSYQTVTSAKRLTKDNMPPVEWFFCGHLDALYRDQDRDSDNPSPIQKTTLEWTEIIHNFTVNDEHIMNYREPFIREDMKCWKLYDLPSIGKLSFLLFLKNNITNVFTVTRDLEGKIRFLLPFFPTVSKNKILFLLSFLKFSILNCNFSE